METKLTLRLNKEVVEKAKKYAQQNKTSLSRMVENFFKQIQKTEKSEYDTSQNIRSLKGILKDNRSDEDIKREYYENRVKKHSS